MKCKEEQNKILAPLLAPLFQSHEAKKRAADLLGCSTHTISKKITTAPGWTTWQLWELIVLTKGGVITHEHWTEIVSYARLTGIHPFDEVDVSHTDFHADTSHLASTQADHHRDSIYDCPEKGRMEKLLGRFIAKASAYREKLRRRKHVGDPIYADRFRQAAE